MSFNPRNVADSPWRRHHVQTFEQQSAHRLHPGHFPQFRVFAPEIIQAHRAVHPPTARPEFLHDKTFTLGLAMEFADQLRENVLHRHQAGDAPEFIQHHRHAASLPLQALEQLQQIHRLRHERGKLDGVRQVRVRVEQQRPRVQNADDRIRRLVVHRQTAVAEFARGRNHFFEGQDHPELPPSARAAASHHARCDDPD